MNGIQNPGDTTPAINQVDPSGYGLQATKEKSLLDFQKDWERPVSKALENYGSLTRDERVWFNVQCLIQDVDNVGLISHYYNYGADHNQETIENLSWLGFRELSVSLARINQLFPNGKPSKDIEERNSVIEAWPDGKFDNLLDELGQQFYRKEPALENALVKHVERMNAKN